MNRTTKWMNRYYAFTSVVYSSLFSFFFGWLLPHPIVIAVAYQQFISVNQVHSRGTADNLFSSFCLCHLSFVSWLLAASNYRFFFLYFAHFATIFRTTIITMWNWIWRKWLFLEIRHRHRFCVPFFASIS